MAFGDGPSAFIGRVGYLKSRTEPRVWALDSPLEPVQDGGYLGARVAFVPADSMAERRSTHHPYGVIFLVIFLSDIGPS
jgi:hypothetical protein